MGKGKEPKLGTVSTHANADQLAVVWDVFFEEQFRPMGRNEGTMTYKLKDVFAPAAAEVHNVQGIIFMFAECPGPCCGQLACSTASSATLSLSHARLPGAAAGTVSLYIGCGRGFRIS